MYRKMLNLWKNILIKNPRNILLRCSVVDMPRFGWCWIKQNKLYWLHAFRRNHNILTVRKWFDSEKGHCVNNVDWFDHFILHKTQNNVFHFISMRPSKLVHSTQGGVYEGKCTNICKFCKINKFMYICVSAGLIPIHKHIIEFSIFIFQLFLRFIPLNMVWLLETSKWKFGRACRRHFILWKGFWQGGYFCCWCFVMHWNRLDGPNSVELSWVVWLHDMLSIMRE